MTTGDTAPGPSAADTAGPPVPSITIVAALDRHGAVGRDGDLPWRLPDDLRHFKALTGTGTLLMGRRTAESLGRALPNRTNLVLTRSGRSPVEGMIAVPSFEAALGLAAGELFVIGGTEVWALALPVARRLVLTEVDAAVTGADTWFPQWDRSLWQEHVRQAHSADDRHFAAFAHVEYRRPHAPNG